MLKELTIKEVETILSNENNVYGVVHVGDHVYKIPGIGYTGPKGAAKFVNELRQTVNNLPRTLS